MNDSTQQNEQKVDQRKLSAEKLESIRQAVIELFSSQAFRDVGLRDVCKKAGITPKTVYKYFGNKDALVIRAIAPDLEMFFDSLEAIEQTDKPLEEKFKDYSYRYFDFYFSNLPLARIVFLYIPSAYFTTKPEFVQTRSLGVMSRMIVQGQKSGKIRDDVEAAELVDAMAAIAMRRMFRLLSDDQIKRDARLEQERQTRLLEPLLGLQQSS